MNALDYAECHRLLHDRGLKGWKLLLVKGNPDHPVNRWLTLWNSDGKMVLSIARTPGGKDYCAHAQRMHGVNTWILPHMQEALSIGLDKWLAYTETA